MLGSTINGKTLKDFLRHIRQQIGSHLPQMLFLGVPECRIACRLKVALALA
jgi:hypothetical protein